MGFTDGLKLVFYNDDADDVGVTNNFVGKGIVEYVKDKQRWVS
jgi:hypothetical protein